MNIEKEPISTPRSTEKSDKIYTMANDLKNRILNISADNQKCRTEKPKSYPKRFAVPDEKISWEENYPTYNPEDFTDDIVLSEPDWADPKEVSDINFSDRESFAGEIMFDINGSPINPMGRTGIKGRGLLGKWGPNHAGDPIVTRVNMKTGQTEALLILRADCNKWAIPGGMLDDGESIFETISRELQEETGVDLDFSKAEILYQGYVDDPRNTDNAWMETQVGHYHLSSEEAANINPQADGIETLGIRWVALSEENLENLYASHAEFLRMITRK